MKKQIKKELAEKQLKHQHLKKELYKAEIARNKVRVKAAEYKEKIDERTPTKINEIFKINKLKVKRESDDIKKLQKKLNDSKELLKTDKSKILKNPSDKEKLIRKFNSYSLRIKFHTKKMKWHENVIKKVSKLKNDKVGKKKFENKLLELQPKLKKIEQKANSFKKEYKELDKKITSASSASRREEVALSVRNLDGWYGNKQSLFDVNIDFEKNKVTALIGASGSGKSTLLKTLNRINDEIPTFKAKGQILLKDHIDIYKLRSDLNKSEKLTITEVRQQIGMVFQQPNPFPMTIFKNVTYGPKINGVKSQAELQYIAKKSLKQAALWEEVKDNLNQLGTSLSGGQAQRLVIARAIANKPVILLMDEPTSALDPKSTKKVEDLIIGLKDYFTIIIVTHSMQQAQRVADKTAFLHEGRLIEYGNTKQIFERPKKTKTKEYVSGKFG